MKPTTSLEGRTGARWSPETETREEMKALLLLRRPLTSPEVALFRRLYEDIHDAYFDDVWKTLVKWNVRGALLPELAQETFLKLWATAVAEGLPEVILAKLRGLAMGLAWNVRARERRSPVTDRGLPSSGSEKPAASGRQIDRALDLEEVVRKLFHALSPEQQSVVDAVVFQDMSHRAAGRALGIPKSTVETRMEAALDRLRELAPDLLSPSQRDLA